MQNSFAHDIHDLADGTASKEEIKAISDELARLARLIQPLPAGRDIPMKDEQSVLAEERR